MKRGRISSKSTAKREKLTRWAKTKPFPRSTFKTAIPRAITATGFPKQLSITHRYVEEISLISTAGLMSQYQFSTNGLFDPNISGTGHQPMYFDACASLYNHYTVLKSKITYVCAAYSSTVANTIVGVYIEDDTTKTPVTARVMAEQNSSNFGLVLGQGSSGPTRFSKSWDARSAFGGDPMSYETLHGSGSGNPTEQQYFTLFAQDCMATGVTNINGIVVIEYETVWDELKNLAEN